MPALLELLPLLADSAVRNKQYKIDHATNAPDGSRTVFANIVDLALLPGNSLEKVLLLYACGVEEYQETVFDPRQILSMILYNDQYRAGHTTHRNNGIGGGAFCCIDGTRKYAYLEKLTTTLDQVCQEKNSGHDSGLSRWSERLIAVGAPREVVESYSPHQLLTLARANLAQLLFVVIHPFWDRNGRTSEELLHLACLSNGVKPRVLCDTPEQRFNERTQRRMQLLDASALKLLQPIAEKMLAPEKSKVHPQKRVFASVFELYEAWFAERGKANEFHLLMKMKNSTPFGLLGSKAVLLGARQCMSEYYAALAAVVDEKIALLDNQNTQKLLIDHTTLLLTAQHLSIGTEIQYDTFLTSPSSA